MPLHPARSRGPTLGRIVRPPPRGIWLLALAACCGCTLLGPDRNSPKQIAASRQKTQKGISELDRGDWKNGERDLAEAIEHCPADPEARRHYAEALWHNGAKAKALAEMQEALRLAGEDTSLRVRIGEMLMELGQSAEALRMANEAIDLDPRLASAWLLRGQIAQSAGQPRPPAPGRHAPAGAAIPAAATIAGRCCWWPKSIVSRDEPNGR